MESVISRDPEIVHGAPCFVGTRVPVAILFDWRAGGKTIDQFLDDYPGVTREAALAAIEEAKKVLDVWF